MGQKSGFFTSSNGDRKYSADWLAQYVAGIISNGVYTTELTTTGGNGDMSVTVGPGRAWINGYLYSNDSNYKLTLIPADGALSRIDLVVLRLDITNRQIALAIVKGLYGSGAPALTRTSDVYELCLAQIAVEAGATQIITQMITDKRADETVCGIVAGAVTQLSTGELLEQLKAGFEVWFDGIKGQLSGDVAGNLQNQINSLSSSKVNVSAKATNEEVIAGNDDTKWMTPAKTKYSMRKVTDTGSILFKGKGYSASNLTDVLPCTGGLYNPSAYQELFNCIEYRNGGYLGLIKASVTGTNESISKVCIDKATGNFYVALTNSSTYLISIKVFSPTGTLLRNTGIVTDNNGGRVDKIQVLNGKGVAVLQNNYGTMGYYGTVDSGLTWTKNPSSGGSAYSIAVCATFGIITTINGDGAKYIYNFSTGSWASYTGGFTNVITTDATTNVVYAASDVNLYRVDINGIVTSIHSLALYPPRFQDAGYCFRYIDGKLYYVALVSGVSNKVIEHNIVENSFSVVYTSDNTSINGIIAITAIQGYYVMFLYDYSSIAAYGIIFKQTARQYYAAVSITGSLDYRYFDIAAVTVNGQKKLLETDLAGISYPDDSEDTIKFKTPLITSIPGADAYICT